MGITVQMINSASFTPAELFTLTAISGLMGATFRSRCLSA
jgi:hypothetical protein